MRVRGIPVGAHWSWLLVFALIVWTLAARLFPRTYPGLSDGAYWTMAAVASVVFFGSVLLHELGHALHALSLGLRIDGITLWLFGGVARFSSRFPSPAAEFRIAAAGPAVSAALAAGFGALAWAGGQAGWPDGVRGVVDYLARINLLVLGFNLVPAMPLDGGRILRAWLWHRQQSLEAATISAARVGRIFGAALIAVGILGFFSDASTGGLWIAFIGWFLLQAAQAEAMHSLRAGVLSGIRVRDVMTPDPDAARDDQSIDELLAEAASTGGHSTYPVVRDGRLVGMISVRRAGSVPVTDRPSTRVAEVMAPREEVPAVRASDELNDALEVLEERGRAVVVDDGHPIGILSPADLQRAMRIREIRGPAAPPPARRAGLAVWIVVTLALAAAIGWLYHPPVVVVAPGTTIDLSQDVTIAGVPTETTTGEYLLTSVTLSRPNALGALVGWLHPDRDLRPLGEIVPPGTDPDRYLDLQARLFRESRTQAAAAAARAAGLPVEVSGSGTAVLEVLPGSPAEDVLAAGDVIVSIDGRPTDVASDLVDVVRSHPAGRLFTLEVSRDGAVRTERLRSRAMDRVLDGAPALGVAIQTRDLSVDLPFEVEFRDRAVAGPSAGLAYALVIADKLGFGDLASGRTIAVSGTIDFAGEVGPVGGVDLKAVAAARADAEIMLVPTANADEALGEPTPVQAVDTLREAIVVLRSAGTG